jgi:membrane-associated phospholipid phosphatase
MINLPPFKSRKYFWLASVAWAILAAQIYLFTNRPGAPTLPLLNIDLLVPFIPVSVVGYVAIYGLMAWACLRITNMQFATQYLFFWMLLQFSAMFVYLVYPISYPRERFTQAGLVKVVNDSALSDLVLNNVVQFWHKLDGPANCLPSLHVSTALMALLAFSSRATLVQSKNRLSRLFAYVVATATVVSTLTFKQHYFVDLLAGALHAAIVYLLVFKSGLIKVNEL